MEALKMMNLSASLVAKMKMDRLVPALLLAVCIGTSTFAHELHSTEAIEGYVGTVDVQNSCSQDVKEEINRGVALLHHMMYGASRKMFTAIAIDDPECAMAHWGISMTLFHPLWAPPSEAELTEGWNAVQKAVALNPATAQEKGFIAAAEAFYKDWETVNHKARIARWEAAQEGLYHTYPSDIEAGAFYALAHLATASKGDKTFTHQKTAGALLEELHAKAPEHPGLFHYIIHAYDNPILASRAVTVARGYLKLAPNVPHALHMPSHIFVRLGLWSDVVEWNRRSAAAANQLSVGKPVSLHAIHAMDYLMYAYLQQAQDTKALDVLAEINGAEQYQDNFATAYGIAAAPARYVLERQQWADAAKLQVRAHSSFPWDKYPWYKSITHFSRGLGAARSEKISEVGNAMANLDAAYERAVKAGESYWAIQVDVQRKSVAAWRTLAEETNVQAVQMMREAADLEDSVDKHPVTPGAVLPARELLGDMLMVLKKHRQALEAYEASLKTSPNRLNSLYGAGRAAKEAGDLEVARKYYTQLMELTAHNGADRPRVKQAKAFLAKT
jgi:tetratricopeptide (TPR) repeat protein